ncbi:MAG: hypothetical protein AAFU54_18915 [Chloroflexota bacterium]
MLNKQVEKNSSKWSGLIGIVVMSLAILACGGAAGSLGEMELDPVNSSIGGLPQFIAPSSTFVPTDTPVATDTQPDVWIPPSNWVPPNTVCLSGYIDSYGSFICTSDATTPGYYQNPGYYVPGATSTAPPTFTPYPTPTPCVASFTYFFGEEVFTDPSNDTVTLGLAVGNVRTFAASDPAQQIVAWTVEIRNLGSIEYVLLAPFQIYVAGIDGVDVRYGINDDAAAELGLELEEPARDGYEIGPSESVSFDMFAYTNLGEVTSIAYILDPYGNGFDGSIAGGNVAYWEGGERTGCAGRISGDYTPQPNLTPQPSATPTPTPDYCVDDPEDCAAVIGG